MGPVVKYFRASQSVYENVRLSLDAAWGLPSQGQETCFVPASRAVRDSAGRLLLAVRDEFIALESVATVLPSLLASGAVEEIDEAAYRASLPRSPV